jgi:hypothetical protein
MDLAPDHALHLMVVVAAGHGAGETADAPFGIDKECVLFFHLDPP